MPGVFGVVEGERPPRRRIPAEPGRDRKKPQAAAASPLRFLDVSRRSCPASRRKTLHVS
jgi:hypothetical protein